MFTPMKMLGKRNFSLTPTDEGDRIDPGGAGTTNDIGREIVWSPELGLFVLTAGALSTTAFLYTSTDALNYTARTIPRTDRLISAMHWFPELSKFVGLYSSIETDGALTSTDGINWSGFDLPAGANQTWDGIAYSASRNRLVAVSFNEGTTGTRVMTSDDEGETWTLRTTPTTDGTTWVGVAYSPSLDRFCACSFQGGTTKRFMTSDDGGVTWTYRDAPFTASWEEVVWSSKLGLFVAVANSPSAANSVASSPDGITWTDRSPAGAESFGDVIWVKELEIFLAVTREIGAGINKIITSEDGITWTVIDSPSDKLWKSVTYAHALGMFAVCEFSDPISIMTIDVNYS